MDHDTRLRLRRLFRRRRRQVEDIGVQAEQKLERYFFRRIGRLVDVRRFVTGWLPLIVVLAVGILLQNNALSSYYLTSQPATGGTYIEGVVGNFTNANPLYATGTADISVSRLLFNGLMMYNDQGVLVTDLADSWSVDASERIYTVRLKPNITWHDGTLLTAADVVFTYQLIQNPDARSPLGASWQGIKVESPDKQTVVFTLPTPLTSFPYALTNGIVPQHKLRGIAMSQLRSVNFNTINPVGTGPFKWEAIEVKGSRPDDSEQRIALTANEQYYRGSPRISRFILRTFFNAEQLQKSFLAREINGVVGLDSVPDELLNDTNTQEFNVPLNSEVMVFLKNSNEILKDVKVRKALLLATDTNEVLRSLGYPVRPVRSPLLPSHTGYDKNIVQLSTNIEEAKKLLDEAGWKLDADGLRTKDGKPLQFKLHALSSGELTRVTGTLQKQWRAVGVQMEPQHVENTELQNIIAGHTYDALLYGINVGTDPDVFAFWHSSQADVRSVSRLNLAEYKSTPADRALEAGRTRSEAGLRAAKYKPFLESWRNDVPAIGLYQPRLLYITQGLLFNFEPRALNAGADRYANVHEWMIRQETVPKQ